MTQPPQSMPSSHSGIIERYEELRREMLSSNGGSGGGPGLALFLRQGMKGWIDAWRHSRIAEPPRPPGLRSGGSGGPLGSARGDGRDSGGHGTEHRAGDENMIADSHHKVTAGQLAMDLRRTPVGVLLRQAPY